MRLCCGGAAPMQLLISDSGCLIKSRRWTTVNLLVALALLLGRETMLIWKGSEARVSKMLGFSMIAMEYQKFHVVRAKANEKNVAAEWG